MATLEWQRMTEPVAPVARLLDCLRRVGMELTAEEVAELLWLAARLPEGTNETTAAGAPPPGPAPPLPRESARPSLPAGRSESFGPSATATSAAGAAGPAAAQLYPTQAAGGDGGIRARAIRSPAGFALPGSLEISRNLRPLKRRVPSRTQVVLDEVATAHHIADTGDWTPVFNPAPERWLELLLLVEESSSMLIWQRTMAELQKLLERQGAFRNVEVLGLRANPGNDSFRLYTGIGPAAHRGRVRRPAELIDPLGRRLIAVVSDCVSPLWHNGVMSSALAFWGRHGLVTLVQVLPDHLWVRTGLRTHPTIFLRSPTPGAANAQFEFEWTTYQPRKPWPTGVAVPVVTLEAVSLGYWARALAGNSNLWIPGVFAAPATPVQIAPGVPLRNAPTTAPDQLLRLFYGTASPTARRLAGYLAAAPLTLPVMRLVQQALLPESRQVHLAEVWLSGLIDRPVEIDSTKPADGVEYLFVAGVREQLLDNLRLGEALEVLSTVSNYVGERIGQPLDFGALVADPTASGEMQIAEGYQPFARVAASTLRRFGGQYADLAQRLEVSVYGTATRAGAVTPEIKVERGVDRQGRPARRRKSTVTIRALLVGINEYAASDKIPQLRGPVNDARLTRAWLHEQCGVASQNIVLLLDRAATKQAIIDAWRQLASQMEEGDQLYFHFGGIDLKVVSSDPNQGDGLEKTLVVYDSVPDEHSTVLTHQELADLAEEVGQRGGHAVIVLDSCRMASGTFARRALRSTLVFAGAAEAEEAGEEQFGESMHGAVSYFIAQAMQNYRPGMTWLDVYDYVLANVKARSRGKRFVQTPQLIGTGDQTVFGEERRTVPPYLVVTKADEREIEVHAPVALGMQAGEHGARLAIYPPGDTLAYKPIGYAQVVGLTETGMRAALESPATIPLASRARVLAYGDAQPWLSVALDDELLKAAGDSEWVELKGLNQPDADLTVVRTDTGYEIHDRTGQIVWRDPDASDMNVSDLGPAIKVLLEHVAAYLRTLTLENATAGPELAHKVDLEVLSATTDGVVELDAVEPITLRLRNRAPRDLYVSVWLLDDMLRVQRIFPATTSCVLLGEGREVQLAVMLQPNGTNDAPARVTFKVFASEQPADVGLITLPPLDRPFELGNLPERTRAVGAEPSAPSPAEQPGKTRSKKTPSDEAWIPGGPVAVSAKLWQAGQTLRVKFLKGDPALQRRVMAAAQEWMRYANLRLEFVEKGDAELRVSFETGQGTWSYVGTDSLNITQDQPTISLGWLTTDVGEPALRRVVLHEFGHALGLAASQMSPVARIPWNKKAAYEYYSKIGWSREQVDAYTFAQYEPSQVRYGPPDPYSIMYHPIPKEITDGHMAIDQGNELSEGDKAFIAQIYPQRAAEYTR